MYRQTEERFDPDRLKESLIKSEPDCYHSNCLARVRDSRSIFLIQSIITSTMSFGNISMIRPLFFGTY